jgi:hypothetical protein
MDIKKLYSEDVIGQIARRLSEKNAQIRNLDTQELIVSMQGPEIIGNNFLRQWLKFNYLHALDFLPDNIPMMSTIEGMMPPHPKDTTGKYILAVTQRSLENVVNNTNKLKNNKSDIKTRKFNDVVIIGNNQSNQDYSTIISSNPLDLLEPNPYMLRNIKSKDNCLNKDQYVFNIPILTQLFYDLANTDITETEARKNILRDNSNLVIPDNFIAGFHLNYDNKRINVRPLLTENEVNFNLKWLESNGFDAILTDIGYLGTINPAGEYKVLNPNM